MLRTACKKAMVLLIAVPLRLALLVALIMFVRRTSSGARIA